MFLPKLTNSVTKMPCLAYGEISKTLIVVYFCFGFLWLYRKTICIRLKHIYHQYSHPRTWWHLFHKSRGPQKWKINLDWSNQYCDSLYHWVRNLQEVKLEYQEKILQGNLLKSIDNKTVKRLKFRRLQPLSSIFSVTHFL